MFKKILIANRGEIACRVIKTARQMGIKTVAVYSDADRDALHVDMADEAVHIGPAPAAESYLVMEKIIEACKATGAEAVHPGYGLLLGARSLPNRAAEEPHRLHRSEPKAIAAMGDKIESKKAAAAPRSRPCPATSVRSKTASSREDRQRDRLSGHDQGLGRRRRQGHAHRLECKEAEEGFELARSEAKSSSATTACFVEKFIENPRHIEIQVLGDKHGNVIYLGERECSIQRRNQKVIEEAPSPAPR